MSVFLTRLEAEVLSENIRARTFMRSIAREDGQVGLLLFDEPSASLDPAAEHGELYVHTVSGAPLTL